MRVFAIVGFLLFGLSLSNAAEEGKVFLVGGKGRDRNAAYREGIKNAARQWITSKGDAGAVYLENE